MVQNDVPPPPDLANLQAPYVVTNAVDAALHVGAALWADFDRQPQLQRLALEAIALDLHSVLLAVSEVTPAYAAALDEPLVVETDRRVAQLRRRHIRSDQLRASRWQPVAFGTVINIFDHRIGLYDEPALDEDDLSAHVLRIALGDDDPRPGFGRIHAVLALTTLQLSSREMSLRLAREKLVHWQPPTPTN